MALYHTNCQCRQDKRQEREQVNNAKGCSDVEKQIKKAIVQNEGQCTVLDAQNASVAETISKRAFCNQARVDFQLTQARG